MVMSNSFFGLDQPIHKPPNVIMTGPLLEINSNLKSIKELNPELAAWLYRATLNDEDVIYISLGSEVWVKPWYVNALYQGCLELSRQRNIRVIWALKAPEGETLTLPLGYDHEKFFVSEWLP